MFCFSNGQEKKISRNCFFFTLFHIFLKKTQNIWFHEREKRILVKFSFFLFREVSCVKVTKMLLSREIFFMREWFLDFIFMYKIERIFFRWNIFSEWVFVKKKKKQEYPKNHSGSWTETFFFFNLVSHSPEKTKSFTWFLFSWGKKSLGWKKTKFWKKKDFCSHMEEVEVDSGKNYFFVKTEKRQKIKKRWNFF